MNDANFDDVPEKPRPIRRGLTRRVPPPTRAAPMRNYDGTEVLLHIVENVTPALVYGAMVSIDRVTDHWHMVVQAMTIHGRIIYLIVSKRGWTPAIP